MVTFGVLSLETLLDFYYISQVAHFCVLGMLYVEFVGWWFVVPNFEESVLQRDWV